MNKQPQPAKSWTSNLPAEEQEEFQKRLLIAKDLFQRLYEMIEVMEKENSDQRVAKGSYDKPAWSEYQADANGFERALKQVQLLLKFTKE